MIRPPAAARLLILGALVCILGLKLDLVRRYGSDLPYWDQWDLLDRLLVPVADGEAGLDTFIQPHNEHRPVFTRLVSAGVLLGNERVWDGRIELVVTAAIHVLLAGCFLAFAFALTNTAGRIVLAIAAVLYFGTSTSWENTLSGFQSQFYFVILFSLLQLLATFAAPVRSWRWWISPVFGVGALFSLGSGLLSSVIVGALTLLLAIRDRRFRWTDAYILLANALVVVAGQWLLVRVPGHEPLQAGSVSVWLDSWYRQLAWPLVGPEVPVAYALLGFVPPLYALHAFLTRRLPARGGAALVALSGWLVLQTMAIAYSRGAAEHGYSPRYFDLLALNALVNLTILLVLSAHAPAGRNRWLHFGAVGLFLLVSLAGLSRETNASHRNILRAMPRINAERIESVRAHLWRNDPTFFQREPWSQLPYPAAPRLAEVLARPTAQAILPSSVRPPLVLSEDAGGTAGFSHAPPPADAEPVPRGLTVWTSTAAGSAELRSNPFVADHSRVSLFVAGTAEAPRLKLRLLDAAGVAYPPLDPDLALAGPRWKQVNFRVPPGPLRLEVLKPAGGWFAITQPFTDTPLSRFARQVVETGPWLTYLGVALGFLAIIPLLPRQRSTAIPRRDWRAAAMPALLAAALAVLLLSRLGVLPIGHSARHDPPGGPAVTATLHAKSVAANPDSFRNWIDEVPFNFGWYALISLCTAAAIFLPGLALRVWGRDGLVPGPATLPVPGLLTLGAIGLATWGFGPDAMEIPSYMVIAGLAGLAVLLAHRFWISGPTWSRDESRSLGIYGCVVAGALAFGALPVAVDQEMNAWTSWQARLVASPPDHEIPYRTAMHMVSGRSANEDRAVFFGETWSIASRGPVAPLMIASAFALTGHFPGGFPDPFLNAWPATRDGFYLARIVGILSNALVILAGAALAGRLATPAHGRIALLWLAVAPVTIINTDFLWPKLLATTFILLALHATVARRPVWQSAGWAALAYLSHPVGGLFIPPLALYLAHQSWLAFREKPQPRPGAATCFGHALAFSACVIAFLLPWLIFKSWVAHPDVFLRYPLGDGRGFAAASSVGSWLQARWDNLWYSLVPGAFFFSSSMQAWIEGPLGEASRWVIGYAKSLPGAVGYLGFVAVVGSHEGAPAWLRRFRRHFVLGAFALMLLFWGYSSDGLGRNCLEPIGALVIVMAASCLPSGWPGWKWLLLGVALEALSVRLVGIIVDPDFALDRISMSSWALLILMAAATVAPAATLFRFPTGRRIDR